MAKRRRSSTGIPGLSFSYKRAFGITSAKRKIAKATGIPTTRSGRRAKAGRMMGCLIPIITAITCAILFCAISVSFAESSLAQTTPEWLAEELTFEQDGFSSFAEYHKVRDQFIYSLYATTFSKSEWLLSSESVKKHYSGAFTSIVATIDEALDLIDNSSTCSVCVFKTNDGAPIYLYVNGYDLSELL